MMTYSEMEREINEIPKFGAKASLSNLSDYLELANHPEWYLRVIHFAGTNGNGSVSAYIDSILRQAGYTTALFTSPHQVKINERFRINFKECSDEELILAWCRVKSFMEKGEKQGLQPLTFFEILFLMGMIIFSQKEIDYCILETGLGGRLDATVLSDPVLSIITSISYDHMEILGDTIEKIAGEKAGIIKPGVPVIFDGNQEEAEKVIKNRAKELGCPYYEVKQASQKMTSYTPDGISFTYDSKIYGTIDLFIPFIAKYQMMNASLAVETMGVLKEVHKIEKETLKAGMEHTKWQGRMETVLPGVIVDGAHNEDGIAKFVETVRYFQDDYPITLLFTTVSDKDFKDMIQKICNGLHFSNVYVTEIWGSRKQSSTELAELFRENGCKQVYAEPDCEKAFELAYAKKGDGLLFVVGSLYLVGEIKDYLKRRNKRLITKRN